MVFLEFSLVEELAAFEEDLRLMVKSIKFRKINNEFQTKLSTDIKKIKNSKRFSLMLTNHATVMKKKNTKNIYWKMLRKSIREHLGAKLIRLN